MKFSELALDKKFKLVGNDIVYTKQALQMQNCCSPTGNAHYIKEGSKKKNLIKVEDDTEVEVVDNV